MKKATFLSIAVATLLVGLTSCQKDYTCSCTVNFGSGDSTFTFMYENSAEEDAEAGCASTETDYKIVDPGATCTLLE